MKKLTTKIEFKFNIEDDIPELNVDTKFKSKRKKEHIIIIDSKRKRKIIDASTKLF